jgi:hypothetical protein
MGELRILYVCTYLCLRMLSMSRIFSTPPFSDSDIWVENFLENTQKFYDDGARYHDRGAKYLKNLCLHFYCQVLWCLVAYLNEKYEKKKEKKPHMFSVTLYWDLLTQFVSIWNEIGLWLERIRQNSLNEIGKKIRNHLSQLHHHLILQSRTFVRFEKIPEKWEVPKPKPYHDVVSTCWISSFLIYLSDDSIQKDSACLFVTCVLCCLIIYKCCYLACHL